MQARRAAMDALMMLRSACALLALAAVGGIGMAAIRFGKGHNPPAAFAMAHGLLAAAGATLLAYAAFTSVVPATAWLALALLLGAGLYDVEETTASGETISDTDVGWIFGVSLNLNAFRNLRKALAEFAAPGP
jgi:hypothetical protein